MYTHCQWQEHPVEITEHGIMVMSYTVDVCSATNSSKVIDIMYIINAKLN